MSRWRRVVAVGCTHGDLVHPVARKSVLDFCRRYKPEIRFDLGDLIDTAAWRRGAAGTKDESKDPRDDFSAAVQWIREYEPTHLAWGNHDWRLYKNLDHPKAIVAELARRMWEDLNRELRILHTKTTPYTIRHNWHYLGGVAWGHGFMYNLNAIRDHAEMLGCPVVMAHLHYADQMRGRTLHESQSFCVGGLVDEDKLDYGHERRQSVTHGHGIVFGEICDTDARLWLAYSENGKPIAFPPGL